jgi:hypothetical protein
MPTFPVMPSKEVIANRLLAIFPVGTQNRQDCVSTAAVNTIFTMLYIDSIEPEEGEPYYLAPKHVYRMTDIQASMSGWAEREDYRRRVLRNNPIIPGDRWYGDNTRESIRDNALRDGLIPIGAVGKNVNVPTTSKHGRYYLKRDFALLFDPGLSEEAFLERKLAWRSENLTPSALARVQINLGGGHGRAGRVIVTFPNGETRQMDPGPSTEITKHVIESFATNFLKDPYVLWISESGNKVPHRDDSIARSIGLDIDPRKNLPDIILVDMAERSPLIVFVEVVATDGAITERRIEELSQIIVNSGLDTDRVAYVTAYLDNQSRGFTKTFKNVGWNSFVWFASEPSNIIVLKKEPVPLLEVIEKFNFYN